MRVSVMVRRRENDVVDDVSSTGAVAAAAEAAAAVWQLECVIVAAPGRRLATPAGEGHVEAS